MSRIKPTTERLKGKNIFESNLSKQKCNVLQEFLITFGRDTKFGNVVILAGGTSSGKGFVLKNLLDIQGKVLDVDRLKELTFDSRIIKRNLLNNQGLDVARLNFKNPDDISIFHGAISKAGLEKKLTDGLYSSIVLAHPDRKPNLIFDVTLKSPSKLDEITDQVKELGYDKLNVHLIWVVNDIEVAIQQNLERDRVVSQSVLTHIYSGVSSTISMLLHPASKLRDILDGRVVFVFNKATSDNEIVLEDKQKNIIFKTDKGKRKAPMFFKEADYAIIKEVGKEPKKIEEIETRFLYKILNYVPEISKATWELALSKAEKC